METRLQNKESTVIDVCPREENEQGHLRVFLIGDAVHCARVDQVTLDGY